MAKIIYKDLEENTTNTTTFKTISEALEFAKKTYFKASDYEDFPEWLEECNVKTFEELAERDFNKFAKNKVFNISDGNHVFGKLYLK